MRIEHVALWSADIAVLRDFYVHWFAAQASPIYRNAATGFESFFVSIGSGPRLELMQRPDVDGVPLELTLGYAHIAINLGSQEAVDHLTGAMASEGVTVLSGPRHTGDGYYESVILDPEGNRIELTS
jgi:lactoylglutathione lyase